MKKLTLIFAGVSLCGALSQSASAQCVTIDSVVKAQSSNVSDSLCSRTIRVYYGHTSSGQNATTPSYSLDGENYTVLPCVSTKGGNKTRDSFDINIASIPCDADLYVRLETHSGQGCNGNLCSSVTYFGNDTLQDYTTLPVNLISFNAKAVAGNMVRLDWTTANQKDFSHFDVQYSADGKSFVDIQKVWAEQEALDAHYSLTVSQQAVKGYYRLKMVDLNQSYKLSDVRAVTMGSGRSNDLNLVLSPNPVQNQINITGTNVGQIIKIYNAQSEQVMELKATESNTSIDVNRLASGLYNALIIDGGQRTGLRFIKR